MPESVNPDFIAQLPTFDQNFLNERRIAPSALSQLPTSVAPGELIAAQTMNLILASLKELETAVKALRDELRGGQTSIAGFGQQPVKKAEILTIYGNFDPVPRDNTLTINPGRSDSITVTEFAIESHRSVLAFKVPDLRTGIQERTTVVPISFEISNSMGTVQATFQLLVPGIGVGDGGGNTTL